MPAIRDAISKLHLKVRKAKDRGSDSKSSLSNGNHKSDHNGDKAIRSGLENDVKGKIAQLETPPSENDKGSRDRTSSKKVASVCRRLQRVESAFPAVRVDLRPLV